MIPPRPSSPPSSPPSGTRIQLNRLFDTREEIDAFLAINFKGEGVKIVRVWEVKTLACIIEVPAKAKAKK